MIETVVLTFAATVTFFSLAGAQGSRVVNQTNSRVIEEETRLKRLVPFHFQSPLVDPTDDDIKITTLVSRYLIDPRALGMAPGKGMLLTEHGCSSTVETRNLGREKDRFDAYGNAATTIRVAAREGCAVFFVGAGFRGGQRQAEGTSVTVTTGLQKLPPDADPECFDPEKVCLRDGRFKAELEWRLETGGGQAVPVATSDDSGLFFFFGENNWEMLVKVMDGCGFNNHFWVFAAAATSVEYTLRVEDTKTGMMKTYFNPLGNAAAAVTDITAFQTCP